jgi:stage III sporulation protein AG
MEGVHFNLKKWKEKLILLIAGGILLVVIALPTESSEDTTDAQTVQSVQTEEIDEEAYRQAVKEELEQLLSQIDGAGKVSVMITWKSSAEQVVKSDSDYEKTESSSEGTDGSKSEESAVKNQENSVYITENNGTQTPYVIKSYMPTVSGVAVVAQGGETASVHAEIVSMVQALFEIPANKIAVTKMN